MEVRDGYLRRTASDRQRHDAPTTTHRLQRGGPRAGGLTDQVVALGDDRGAAGGVGVGGGSGREVAGELVQVAADGVPAVSLADHVAQPVGLAQAGGGAE